MNNQSFGDGHVAFLLILIATGCVAYEHVPFFGATPAAIGVVILLNQALNEVVRRVKGTNR